MTELIKFEKIGSKFVYLYPEDERRLKNIKNLKHHLVYYV